MSLEDKASTALQALAAIPQYEYLQPELDCAVRALQEKQKQDNLAPRCIAVDFDGTICVDAYPDIGAPRQNVIQRAKQAREDGVELVLWTCREGQLLADALKACAEWGLEFDAVNDNPPRRVAFYGTNPRKVGADEYWDDHAVDVR